MYKNEKHAQAVTALGHIARLMKELRPDKELIINYVQMDEDALKLYSDWYIQRFHLMTGDEYVTINMHDGGSWPLLYVINVTGNNVLAIAAETMDLLSRKF